MYFCFLNPTLSCLSAWPPRSFTSLYFQGYPYFYNSPHLISVLSFHLQPHYFNTQYFILSSSSKLYPKHQAAKALECTRPTRWYLPGFEPALTWKLPDPDATETQRWHTQSDTFAESFSTKEHFKARKVHKPKRSGGSSVATLPI